MKFNQANAPIDRSLRHPHIGYHDLCASRAMCITLLTKYACGHESTELMHMKRACKKNQTHTRTKNHACTKCNNTYMTGLREECDDTKRRLQDADCAYAGALERMEAIEDKYRSLNVQNAILSKQLKSFIQSTRESQERQDESMNRIETLAAELETTRLKVPKNECIYTEILRYYACGHDTKESCSTKKTPREDCQYKQVLGTDCDEICADCQVWKKAEQEAAMVRLAAANAAQERTIHELRLHMQNVEMLYKDPKEPSETPIKLTRPPGLTTARLLASPSEIGPLDQCEKDNTVSRIQMVVKNTEDPRELREIALLEGETLVEEDKLSGTIEDRCDEKSARSFSCFATMDKHLKAELMDITTVTSTAASVETSQFEGGKSQERDPGSVTVTEDSFKHSEIRLHVPNSTAVST
ncbi:hypothetical protein J1614_002053 [Plenodomus biglobosus]|nr:hypothetical protein J1614_002053 [Plenodomus biglobosus]